MINVVVEDSKQRRSEAAVNMTNSHVTKTNAESQHVVKVRSLEKRILFLESRLEKVPDKTSERWRDRDQVETGGRDPKLQEFLKNQKICFNTGTIEFNKMGTKFWKTMSLKTTIAKTTRSLWEITDDYCVTT